MQSLSRCGAVVLMLATLGLGGCQSLSLNANTAAQLRIVDASQDSGLMDVYQNGTGLAYNVSYGTITSYMPMQPGAYTLSADKAGTRQALLSSNDTLAPGRQYTEVIGNVAAGLQQTLLVDQTQPAAAGEVAVRLFQQAPRAGNVDVYMVPKGARLAGLSPLAVNLGFNALTGYLHAPAGSYALVVVPTGTALVSSTTTLMSGAQLAYESGSARTVVLIDQETLAGQRAGLTPNVQTIVADDVEPGSND